MDLSKSILKIYRDAYKLTRNEQIAEYLLINHEIDIRDLAKEEVDGSNN